MKIAIVTDSTAYLSEETRKHKDLFILPIPVVVDGKTYGEGVEISEAEFFEKIAHSEHFPTTSQPSLGEVIELYERIKAAGYEQVVAIHMSSGISGFIRNITTIKDSVDGLQVDIFDSKITSAPMGNMVEAALKMVEEGRTKEEILEKLAYISEKTKAFMIVEDLNHLVRGGRLTNGAALLGNLLHIKPILTFTDGQIVLEERIRTAHKAFRRAEELIEEYMETFDVPVRIYIIHSNALEKALELQTYFMEKYAEQSVELATFGPVIGTHLGDKAIGIGISAI